nr:unnamed protein product [Callosobruchus chinensis]
MEITECLLARNTMRQETILNQSVMDFTMISPAPINSHYMITVNQSATMEFTCQHADGTQGGIMEESMDITKGVSDSDKGLCGKKHLRDSKINAEDTIYDTVTMDLTGIVPPIPVLPKIIPQRDIILRDASFNESATMDFTKSLFIPQMAQAQDITASIKGPTAEDISIHKTVSESTSAVFAEQCPRASESALKTTNASSNDMDLSVYPTRTSEAEEISSINKTLSDSSCDKLGATYTVPKKVSLSKTYLPDRENIPYPQSLSATNEKQQQIAAVLDKENRKPLVSVDINEVKPILCTSYAPNNVQHEQIMVQNEIQEQLPKGLNVQQDESHTNKLKPILRTRYAPNNVEDDKEFFHEQGMVQNKIEEELVKESNVEQDDTHSSKLVNTKKLKPILRTSYVSNNVEQDRKSLQEQSMIPNKIEAQWLKGPNVEQDESHTNKLKPILRSSYAPNNVEQERESFHEQNMIPNKIEEQWLKGPNVEQDDSHSSKSVDTNKSKLILHTSYSSNNVEHDKVPFNEQSIMKKENQEQVLKGPQVDQDETESSENAKEGDISEMFMPSQQLNEDGACNMLNVLYSQKIKPPELSSPENSAAISAMSFIYLPATKNPINFDRQKRNERTIAFRARFEQMRKEMHDILSDFKLPQVQLQPDRVAMEISKADSDSSSTIPTNPTMEEDENDIVVVKKTLKHDHVSSVTGAKYDILTFLDYVHMSVDEVLTFNGQWVNLQIKYGRSHKLRMTRDYRVIVEVLNAEHVIWWIITSKMSLSTVPGLCEDLTAKTQLGEPVNEECIKKLARSITPGSQFLCKFMLKLTAFTEKLIHRLDYAKEAEKFKEWRFDSLVTRPQRAISSRLLTGMRLVTSHSSTNIKTDAATACYMDPRNFLISADGGRSS